MVGNRSHDPRYVNIPYGVNPVEATPEEVFSFRSRMGIPHAAKVLVCLSRFENRTKRLNLLLEALEPILKENPDVVLLLVGEGPDREQSTAWVRSRGLSRQILMPGFIMERDIPACLHAGTLFVFASALETFGVVLVQAMAAGLPIVAMDSSCIGEVVRHGECGLVVPDRDLKAMRDAIVRLLGDEGLRRRMAECGRERARTTFDWDFIAARHEQVFQEVVDESRRGAS